MLQFQIMFSSKDIVCIKVQIRLTIIGKHESYHFYINDIWWEIVNVILKQKKEMHQKTAVTIVHFRLRGAQLYIMGNGQKWVA